MTGEDTPPPSDTDEIECDYDNDDDVLFEIIDLDDVNEAAMQQQAESLEDDAKVTFFGHSGSVYCCNLDKTGTIACSGGHDDKGYIWNPATGVKIFECTDHTDSVVSAVFNHDSSLVATGDMEGLVQVWDVKDGKNVWNFNVSQITWMEWLNDRNTLVAGTSDGEVWLWNINDSSTQILPSYGSGTSCGKLMPDGKKCAVGYDDGKIKFWNLEQDNKFIEGSMPHDKLVAVIASQPENNLTLTGSLDGTAKLIKSTDGQVLWTIKCAEEDSETSIESVDFVHGHPMVATGSNAGILSIWDISTKIQRSSYDYEMSIIKLICDPAAPLVYVAALDGYVKLFDARSGSEERKWGGHTAEVLDFALSRDRDKIVTASEDGTCKVFKVSQS